MTDRASTRDDAPAGRDVQDTPPEQPEAGSTTVGWLIQVITGALVLLLVTLHMIANHFIVPNGLRSFTDVVDYLRTPIVLFFEVTFLVVVTWHGLLGLRAVLFDFGLSRRTERAITGVLAVVGVVTVGYGLWLTSVVISWA
jgi:succinate dehydrogenase hydrophobic anchor subunit